MREYQEIKVEKTNSPISENKYTHPAFGMVGFYRVSGGKRTLFGSSIDHNDRICLRIRHGEEFRGLSNDFYMGTGDIVEVEMSYSQFAECISAMNVGDGVPCTITYTEKDGHIPAISKNMSKRQQFRDEFTEYIQKAMGSIQEQIIRIQESLDSKKNLGVKERQEIVKKLGIVRSNIGCNLDFVASQFDEQIDKSVNEAKGEIEAFCQNKLLSIAERSLVEHKDDFQKLESPINTDLLE